MTRVPVLSILEIVKTTIDIPEEELQEAMRTLGVTTKREAVVTALREFNRRARMARLVGHAGTLDFLSNRDLESAEIEESTNRNDSD